MINYFRYVYHEKIHPEQQMKTHIFSTFFYECLQRALKKTAENGSEYVYKYIAVVALLLNFTVEFTFSSLFLR